MRKQHLFIALIIIASVSLVINVRFDIRAATPFLEGAGHIKYYGFYGERIYDDPKVVGSINAAFTAIVCPSDAISLVTTHAYYGVHSLYSILSPFWWTGTDYCNGKPISKTLVSDYQANWDALAVKIAPYVADGSIAAFYLYDEPYGNFKIMGISRNEAYIQLKTAARTIKRTFPNTPIFVVEDRYNLDPQNSDPSNPEKLILFPPEIDWVGFNCYRGTFESCADEGYGIPYYFNLVKSGLASNQKIVLVPQIAPTTWGPGGISTRNPTTADQDYIINLNNKYSEFARAQPEVVAVIGYTSANYPAFSTGRTYWWGGLEDKWADLDNTVIINYLRATGRRLLYDTSCKITFPFPAPSGYAGGATTFIDNYDNASSDQARCMKRALEHYYFFGVPSVFKGYSVTASFLKGNTVIETAIAGGEATPTPVSTSTPTPISTPIPTATPTPISTSTSTPIATIIPTLTPTSTATPYPTLTFTPIPPPQAPPIFQKILRFGSRGDDVRLLQTFLAGDSEIYPQKLVTSFFGRLTENAVKRFQKKYGIVNYGTPYTTGYGIVGPKTRAKLNELYKRFD